MRIPFRQLIFCSITSLSCMLAACTDSDNSGALDYCLFGESMDECTLNEARCDDGNSQVCQRNENDGCLKWTVDPSNFLGCMPGCTVGSVKCSGSSVLKCQANASGGSDWISTEVCSAGCVNGQCVQDTSCPQENAKQCAGNTVQTCQRNASGTLQWTNTDTCSNGCQNGVCMSTSCTPDTYRCSGKALQKCVGTGDSATWQTQKSCQAYCKAEYKTCTEDLPPCKLKPGSKGTVLQWTDGDTLWARAETDGTCNDYEYTTDKDGKSSWKNIRYRIRIEGIDAPECSKYRNNYYYYVCKQDTKYTATNERMGYESWKAAEEMLPYQSHIFFSCEKTQADGSCDYDSTYDEDQEQAPRHVAYVGFEKNNASYDYSVEIARKGLAFANTERKFVAGTTKLGEICKAQKEAMNNKIGLWSLASTPAGVLKLMSSSKQSALKTLESTCNSLMK